ncbi:MAG: hypothetical protein QXG18_02300 [Candidatus Pacearchaeota archaeon]
MTFIKKIFEDRIDESVHRQFIRFGKGTYQGRAVIKAIKQQSKIKIGTSFELANDVVEFVADLGGGKTSGIILSKEDTSKKFPDLDTSRKAGMFVSVIEQDCNEFQLKELLKDAYACLLDIESQGILLKTKKRLPKPGKSGDLKIDDKFCQLELSNQYLKKFHDTFLFDLPLEFKKVRVEHTYIIKDIIIPKELEKEKDFAKIREKAKRKGKVIRKITIDSKELVKEKDFEA